MFEKLSELERRYEELNVMLADPSVTSDGKKFATLAKEHSDLSEVVRVYRKWQGCKNDFEQAKEILDFS